MGAASFTFILLCFAGCLSYGSSRRGTRKIIGGSDTAIEDAPYMVKLSIRGIPCGGSIISKSWVVTAAHCFNSTAVPDRARRTKVCSGASSDRFFSDCTQHTVDNVITHEEFDTPLEYNNDIAVVHVTSPFTFSSNTQAIRLPSRGASDPSVGKICGWGRNELNPDGTATYKPSPFQLQCAQVPLVNNCPTYFPIGDITDKMICYGYMQQGSADACQGDSGGPLSNDGTLYGITSWGIGCSSVLPGVYTKVTQFVDWIKSKTEIN